MSDQNQEPSAQSAHQRTRPTRPLAAPRLSRGSIPASPQFTQPVRQILLMLTVLVLVLVGGWLTYSRILPIFLANQWLNGLILGVFTLGVLGCFWQLGQLVMSISWIERFAERRKNAVEHGIRAKGDGDIAPRLLAPLAAMLGNRGPVGGAISTSSARSILDSVASRIEEIRDITKYLANLLIFLGLLGTFYGLATTVPAVIETIRALAPNADESAVQMFEKLIGGLEAQLGGMATAFSSSLLGLAGSLVVGLLELFVTHGQNRFYRELEEWLSGFTRLSLAGSDGEGHAAEQGVMLDQVITHMDALQRFLTEREVTRDEVSAMADERVLAVAEGVESLSQALGSARQAEQSQSDRLAAAIDRFSEKQDRLLEALQAKPQGSAAADVAQIDAALNKLADRLAEGREEMVAELRLDLLVLTRAVRAARFGDPFRDDQLPDPDTLIEPRG